MMMKAAPYLALAAMAGSGIAATGLKPSVEADTQSQSLEAQESNAAASLVGQFRSNFASWLWIRTDLYLHNGVELRQMTEAEHHDGVHASEAAKGEELHDESEVTTVVPPRERDFRGILGDVERAVSSYADMHGHKHNNPQDALPLFRLMTWADPTFIQGWAVGSMVMAQNRDAASTNRAMEFLREGLAANPRNVELLADLGRMTIMRERNIPGAVPILKRAIAEQHRIRAMSESEQEGLQIAYRLLALCYRDMAFPERSAEVASEGLGLFTNDHVLERLANPPPSIVKATAPPK